MIAPRARSIADRAGVEGVDLGSRYRPADEDRPSGAVRAVGRRRHRRGDAGARPRRRPTAARGLAADRRRRGMTASSNDERSTVALVGGGVVADRLRSVARDRYRFVEPDVSAPIVVLASPGPHAELAAAYLERGVHVVSTSGSTHDVRDLLELDDRARAAGASLVVGAAVSPGLSGLFARHLAASMSVCDELHITVHGTAGPACAASTTVRSAGGRSAGTTAAGSSGPPAAAGSCAGSPSRSAPVTATAPRCPIRGCSIAASRPCGGSAPAGRRPVVIGSRRGCRC